MSSLFRRRSTSSSKKRATLVLTPPPRRTYNVGSKPVEAAAAIQPETMAQLYAISMQDKTEVRGFSNIHYFPVWSIIIIMIILQDARQEQELVARLNKRVELLESKIESLQTTVQALTMEKVELLEQLKWSSGVIDGVFQQLQSASTSINQCTKRHQHPILNTSASAYSPPTPFSRRPTAEWRYSKSLSSTSRSSSISQHMNSLSDELLTSPIGSTHMHTKPFTAYVSDHSNVHLGSDETFSSDHSSETSQKNHPSFVASVKSQHLLQDQQLDMKSGLTVPELYVTPMSEEELTMLQDQHPLQDQQLDMKSGLTSTVPELYVTPMREEELTMLHSDVEADDSQPPTPTAQENTQIF